MSAAMEAQNGIAMVSCMLGLYKQGSSHYGVASNSLEDVYATVRSSK
jgi:hypothetical protein